MPDRILCSICARGGSKGVAGKNLRVLAGKPLIVHSIEQALLSKAFETIAVSSDSDDILERAQAAGAHIVIKRPPELATDTVSKIPAIRHCGAETERLTGKTFDIFVDLDATSPLRIPGDITSAIELLKSARCGNVITGAPARRSPYFNLVEMQADGSVTLSKVPKEEIVRRQDAPRCFDMNASIYVWTRQAFLDGAAVFGPGTRLYEMPPERSIDIDSELDFNMVEYLIGTATATL